MRRTVAGFWWSPTMEGTPALVVTAAFFALGSLIGFFWAYGLGGGGVEILTGYLERFLSVAQSGGLDAPDLVTLLWRTFRWPTASFLFGFTALGLVGLPTLSGMRGFYLAFSVSAFVQAYGRNGLALAFLLLGLPCLLTVPVFFLLTTQSFTAALHLAGRRSGQGKRDLPYRRDYFLRCGLCGGAACLALLFERYLIPVLVVGLAGTVL